MQKFPFPPGHRRYGEPKEPSMAEVWRMLEAEHGIAPPSVTDKINGTCITAGIGDYDFPHQAFPIYLSGHGGAYPERYWFEREDAMPKQGQEDPGADQPFGEPHRERMR